MIVYVSGTPVHVLDDLEVVYLALRGRMTSVAANAAAGGCLGREKTQRCLAGLEKLGVVDSEYENGKCPRVYWRVQS